MTVADYQRAEPAYDALAADYDRLTAHHDYALWVGMLDAHLTRLGSRGGWLLDVGCGTGRSTAAWRARGYEVVGVDVSAGMLGIARTRLPGTPLHLADVCDLPDLGTYAVVSCLCDVINCVEPSRLSAALGSIAGCLAEDGLLVFDANTRHAYRTYFSVTEVAVDDEDALILWRGDDTELTIESFRRLGTTSRWQRTTSVQRQHHHDAATIRHAIEDAGLVLVDSFGHGFDAVAEWPLDEDRHTKGIYIARKGGR